LPGKARRGERKDPDGGECRDSAPLDHGFSLGGLRFMERLKSGYWLLATGY
jgi:hypothetical protein